MNSTRKTAERRGRVIAAVIGAAAILVLVLAVCFKDTLVVEYHLSRLQRDPGYLSEIVDCQPGSNCDSAILRDLTREEGQDALFGLYLRVYKRFLSFAMEVSVDNPSGMQNLKQAVLAAHGNDFVCRYEQRVRRGESFLRTDRAEGDERESNAVGRYLSLLKNGRAFTTSAYPRFEFSFQGARQAFSQGRFATSALKKLDELGFPETVAIVIVGDE